MNFTAHALSGLALTEVAFIINGVSLQPSRLFGDFAAFINQYAGFEESRIPLAAAISAACVAGAIFPDIDMKILTIRHRTITHWPVPYLILVTLAWWHLKTALYYFLLGALLHLLIDSFTQAGIPIFSPHGKRYGLRYIKNRGVDSFFVCIGILCFISFLWFLFA